MVDAMPGAFVAMQRNTAMGHSLLTLPSFAHATASPEAKVVAAEEGFLLASRTRPGGAPFMGVVQVEVNGGQDK
jgi:ABC-type hemin transport system substrate-binding protein